MATPFQILIVALAFGIVGTYMLCCRHFINSSEREAPSTAKPATKPARDGSTQSRPAHA